MCGVLHRAHFLNDWTIGRLNIIYIQYFSIIADKTLFTLRASLLLSSSNDASADAVDDEGSFQFSPKAEFTSLLYVHITLAAGTEAAARALHNYFIIPKTF